MFSCFVLIFLVGFVELFIIGFDGVGVDFDIFVLFVVISMVSLVGFYSGFFVIYVVGEYLYELSFCYFGD